MGRWHAWFVGKKPSPAVGFIKRKRCQTIGLPASFAAAMTAAPTNLTPRPLPHPGRGIAIISERESLGDGFYKLHLLRALRRAYPEEKITWIVSESDSPYRTLMARIAAPLIDTLIVEAGLRRPWHRAWRRLRALPHFGLAIDHRSNNAVIAATRALLEVDIYQAATPGYFFCRYRPPGLRPRHKLDRLMALAGAAAGCPLDGSGRVELPDATTRRAADLLPDGPHYVAIAPGASGPPRYWPLDRQIALAGWMSERGWQPVILLGPMERHMLVPLRQGLPGALFPGCSETEMLSDIDLWLALGRRLSSAVSNDTGTGHLLAETGIPLLSLFGPTDPRVWAPVSPRGRVIWSRDYGGPQMSRIPYADVQAAVAAMMA
jgi:ADP-heptose:LPS heptosyltransferase